MYIYKSIRETYYNSEIGSYTAYAVEAYKVSSATPLCRIPDAFANPEKAEEFIALCNQHQPEPLHLTEICIEFIG